ncbi:MAG: hypothetical protein KF862_11040 [Chitinophagaceae bacterium]|nr:hypothetical protein [Chitinophagaceae bacterium]
MGTTKKVCVVIPVHKPEMTYYEKVSLNACCRHLKNHDCFLVYPQQMDIAQYLRIHPGVIAKPVPAAWLSSVDCYNRMKVGIDFYRLFSNYRFMLTYELDAYIFSPDLENHRAFEFDFIGAPIFEGFIAAGHDARFLGCLNSGFSMRNIQSCMYVMNNIHIIKRQWKLFKFFKSNFSVTRKILLLLKWKKLPVFEHDHWVAYMKEQYFHEDIFWSELIPVLFPFFRIADFRSACSFSFEVNARSLYELTGRQLPLGCHAWAKFMDFWDDHIHRVHSNRD